MALTLTGVDELLPWYWLRSAHGIGPSRIRELIDHLGSPGELIDKSIADYRRVSSVGKKLADSLEEAKSKISSIREQVVKDLEAADRLGVTIITLDSDHYPPLLRAEVNVAPAILYVQGDLAALQCPRCMAFVGTRNPSQPAEVVARRMAADLATEGWVIVSGLALGIDASSHRGVLDAEGSTIAVLGGGLDQVHPYKHRDLAKAITSRGVLLTEHRFGVRPIADLLRKRNHIIAAMSAALFAVEFPAGSGTEISVKKAREQLKPIFALDHGSDAPRSAAGSMGLINERLAWPVRRQSTSAEIEKALKDFDELKPSVILDLDGVVVDTRELEYFVLRTCVEELEGQAPHEDALRAVVGRSPREALRTLAGRLPEELWSRYQDVWARSVRRKVRAPRHLKAVLARLRGAAGQLGVVTSRNKQHAELLLEAAGVREEFSVVVSWGDTTAHEPAPEPLEEALARLGSPSLAVYVGDRPEDARAALAAGIGFVGAAWFIEAHQKEELASASRGVMLDRVTDLVRAVDDVRRRVWATRSLAEK